MSKSDKKEIEFPNSQTPLNIDEVIKRYIGPVGLWQILVLFFIYFGFPPPIFVGVFLLTRPKHRCMLDAAIEGNFTTFDSAARFVGPWWPEGLDAPSDDDPLKNKYGCFRYSIVGNDTSPLIACDRGFVYEDKPGQYPDTITKTWDLICDRSWYIPFSTTVYMLGMMFGFLCGGAIGGVYGRRFTIIVMSFIFVTSANLTSLSYDYTMYSILRGIMAFSVTSRVSCSTVLMTELTLASYRSMFVSIANLLTGLVLKTIVILLAYLIPMWRWFNFSAMSWSFVSIFMIFVIPESPRWLLSQNRPKEARMVLYRAYRINRIFRKQTQEEQKETEDFFSEEIKTYQKFIHEQSFLNRLMSKMGIFRGEQFDKLNEDKKRQHAHRIVIDGTLKMFGSKELAKKTLLCILMFFLQVTVYFGLTFYARVMKDSIYLLVLYNALQTIPSQVLNFFLYRCFQSRKKPLMALYTINFVTLAALSFYLIYFRLDSSAATVVVVSLALILMQAAIAMLYVLIPELFTSDLRTQGLGVSSGLGRIGGLICDFINELDLVLVNGSALAIYAVINLLQVLLIGVFLKDTTGNSMKDFSSKLNLNEKCKNEIDHSAEVEILNDQFKTLVNPGKETTKF
ncbi:hypothetical protein Ciccas_011462 [Cichlidogyrus casuarinus]|uniref:Major facilitator superfamily (MFS) profile domain-containing protein n=1 Tax=Cichlidogyrus casuarinus TaxID=1844966 RepID=A0ABD2PRL0_9PLAT